MVDVQTVSIAIASASVIAGVIYYALQLRHQIKQRQTDLITRLYSIFATEKFQKEYHKFMADLETNDYATFQKIYAVDLAPIGLFFNEVGILLENKLIDIGLVNSLLGGTIKRYWERVKPIVADGRRKLNQPTFAHGVEYLYNEMKRREQQPASKTA